MSEFEKYTIIIFGTIALTMCGIGGILGNIGLVKGSEDLTNAGAYILLFSVVVIVGMFIIQGIIRTQEKFENWLLEKLNNEK